MFSYRSRSVGSAVVQGIYFLYRKYSHSGTEELKISESRDREEIFCVRYAGSQQRLRKDDDDDSEIMIFRSITLWLLESLW